MNSITFFLTLLVEFTGILTGGYTASYLHDPAISDKSKEGMVRLHAITSLVLAFIITNNYLVTYPSFAERFASSGWWIVLTAFILLMIFLILLGTLMTLLAGGRRIK